MTDSVINNVMKIFAAEAKRIYGDLLRGVYLYGSCARGDYRSDSDIDVIVLLDVPVENIGAQRRKIFDVTDRLDWDYDVVIAPVVQSAAVYEKYKSLSGFYRNISAEGVKIA